MTLYNEILAEFRKHDAELLGISLWCHAAFARDRHLHFLLLADFYPRATSRGNTARIAQARASASAHYLSSIDRASSRRAIALRSRSMPAPTELLLPSENSQIRQNPMANLRTPITLVEYRDYECSIVR
jgi:hypothetical protein